MKLIRLGLVLIILAAMVAMPVVVYADEPDPDSTPSVEEFRVWRNVRETGDFLLVFLANIPYATPPDYPVNLTYTWRMFDTNNVTELGQDVGYPYDNDGYGYNIYSMYWDSDDAPAWNQNYPVRLSQNPAHFDDPQDWNFYLGAGDYSTMVDDDDVESELTTRLLGLARTLNQRWGLTTDEYLTIEIEVGTRLSMDGETVFRGCIYGVQGMAPGIFAYVMTGVDIEPREWSENYTGNLTGQWTGTWVQDAKDAGQALFGTDYDLLSLILAVGLCIGAAVAGIMVGGDGWNGMLDASMVGVMAARLGMFGLGYWGLLCAMCVIYIGLRIFKPFS